MANERLRAALLERGVTPDELAAAIEVDVKTIERWITKSRTPYRRHRYAVAAFLRMEETYLWPDALTAEQATGASESEILNVFPHRSTVPNELWHRLFESAEEEIGVLVYSGLFLSEDMGIHRIFRNKADAGVKIHILLGDPKSEQVAQRGADEGVDEAMAGKIKNALVMYKPLRGIDGIEFRLHDKILYNSIYRADDQLLVNTHIYGFTAAHAPVLHLRKVAGGSMVTNYLTSFERVWDSASPLE
ncbi:XRE family transcriptional regulator [Actinospica sp. MGRD01-02]|uniref:XRE family transcriptional regulator n=1 Tax=Actinospica acidithermotolerans TaxID=2828514 RepID=A0A941IMQ9_9ACTN|nr:XRE family transcriptional regulator [Actinospica acidithermotolerans]